MVGVLPSIDTTVSTGISGLDTVTKGGYTREHATLVRGASGTGKTLIALMFGATTAEREPVVFASFDEPINNLERYVSHWQTRRKITFLDFTIAPEVPVSSIEHVDLGAILIRLENALEKTGARVIVFDAFDAIFSTFGNAAPIRRQLHKVFAWCRSRGVTLLATSGVDNTYQVSTDVMDYASDCTILLAQDMENGLMTRKLRVLKLRGRGHGTNEYPFLIDSDGISVLPVTDISMESKMSRRKLSTGIAQLDTMLGGKGIWVGSTMMISGQSGTGKSLYCANLAEQACLAGYRVLYQSFEESPNQFLRDIKSVGINLKKHMESGQCSLVGRRPVEMGMEEHVILILRNIAEFKPDVVIVDPVSSLADLGTKRAFKNTTLRLCHAIKAQGVTAVLTELLADDSGNVSTMNVSSIVDTWIRLSRVEENGVMSRQVKVHKSRGAATSALVHEFSINKRGINIHMDKGRQQ